VKRNRRNQRNEQEVELGFFSLASIEALNEDGEGRKRFPFGELIEEVPSGRLQSRRSPLYTTCRDLTPSSQV